MKNLCNVKLCNFSINKDKYFVDLVSQILEDITAYSRIILSDVFSAFARANFKDRHSARFRKILNKY